jgi:hypothetical protein
MLSLSISSASWELLSAADMQYRCVFVYTFLVIEESSTDF